MENRYNEKESGLNALITFKNGFALKNGAAWKNMTVDPEDEDWWTLENEAVNGNEIALIGGNKIRTITIEHIGAYINYEDAELSAGDTVMFVFRPSMENRYNVEESGMFAHITFKNGYALKSTWGGEFASWKNMVMQDEDTYILENVLADGQEVGLVNGNQIRSILNENIPAYLLPSYEDAVLEAGDLVVFMYTPSEYSAYDPTYSGLSALIVSKHSAQGVEAVQTAEKAVKVIMNGQLFIIRDGKTYNASGVVVK
jgi:hypothetical protein